MFLMLIYVKKLINFFNFFEEFEKFDFEEVKTLNNNDNEFKTILVLDKNDILH